MTPEAPAGLPRLLAAPPHDHRDHVARYGPIPELRRRAERAEFVAMVERSGLRGRGGGRLPDRPQAARRRRRRAPSRRGGQRRRGRAGEPQGPRAVAPRAAPGDRRRRGRGSGRRRGGDPLRRRPRRPRRPRRARQARSAPAPGRCRVPTPGGSTVVPSRYVAGEESARRQLPQRRRCQAGVGAAAPVRARGARPRHARAERRDAGQPRARSRASAPSGTGRVGTTDEPGSVLTTTVGARRPPRRVRVRARHAVHAGDRVGRRARPNRSARCWSAATSAPGSASKPPSDWCSRHGVLRQAGADARLRRRGRAPDAELRRRRDGARRALPRR